VSDRDPRFLSTFWRTLHRICGSRLALSASYHPQTDGATEVVHRELVDLLRCTSAVLKERWDEFLDLMEFAHNAHPCASTGFSPFVLLYGRQPRTFSSLLEADIAAHASQDHSLATFLREKAAVLAVAQRNVLAAQARQKHAYDRHRRTGPELVPGQWVYVDARHYNVSKVASRWLGPFRIMEHLGPLTYRLELPAHLRIHDVFHSAQLRPQVTNTHITYPSPPIPLLEPPATLELIMGHRRGRGAGGPLHYRVKYLDQPMQEDCWLPESEARALSPEVVTEYKRLHSLPL